MTGELPIHIDNLVRQRTIDGEEIENKTVWIPNAVRPTLCAVNNHFHNLCGSYVALGVEVRNGRPLLPPKYLSLDFVDTIQNARSITMPPLRQDRPLTSARLGQASVTRDGEDCRCLTFSSMACTDSPVSIAVELAMLRISRRFAALASRK